MRTLEGLLGANGKPGKIDVLLKGGEEALKEYSKDGAPADSSTVKCYVLTAHGDIISVDITAGAHTADVFDLEVDGILRASVSSKALAKTFHGTINKICFKAKSGTKRGDGAKYCGMKVQRRDASMDATFSRDGTPSAVSSLVIKAWRKNPTPEASVTEAANEDTATQLFSWEEYASWKELKHYITKEGPQPPFEIDFIDSTKLSKKQKDKMDEIPKRNSNDYSLIATFVFELQSTVNLTALGFEDVPTYTPTLPPAKPPRAKKESKAKKSQAEAEDEDEDDVASIEGVEDPKKGKKLPEASLSDEESEEEGRWVLKSKLKPQPKSSEEKPKAKKPKAPPATFVPQPTTMDIINSLLPPKPKSIESKKEVGKSLCFSRTELFSSEPAIGSQNPLETGGDDSASSSNIAVDQHASDNPLTPIAPTESLVESVTQENGVRDEVEPKQKGLVLHGEVGGPARRAFLARGDTQETESQSQVDPTEMITKTTEIAIENSFTAINQSPIYESPEFEPLTPPVSAKKPLPKKDDFEFAQRLIGGQTHALPQIDMNKLSGFSQATTASTQDRTSQLEVPSAREPPVDFDKMIKDLEAMSRESGLARASSPALSEATEVADPMEIMESVKNSQRKHVSFNQEDENFGYHTIASPILGSNVRDQVRESWQYKSPTPTGSFSFPQSEKRKADAITGREKSEYEEPRKTTFAPSMGKTSLEEKMMAAKAKLAVATERNRKLEEERQAALALKKKNDEVKALLRKAEEMEQTNDELEAEINALRESNLV